MDAKKITTIVLHFLHLGKNTFLSALPFFFFAVNTFVSAQNTTGNNHPDAMVCPSAPTALSTAAGRFANYAAADAAGYCFNNLSASTTYCYSYVIPASGNVGIQMIINNGCGGCANNNNYACGGFTSSCAGTSGGNLGCMTHYDATCVTTLTSGGYSVGDTPFLGFCTPAQSRSSTYVFCFAVGAGCSTMDVCPVITTGAGACGLLPIEMLSFSIACQGDKVKVSWTTASEINNDFFTIERSIDGTNYTALGNVKGAGNSNAKLDYEFIDYHPEISNLDDVYYRIKQTDLDGKFEYFMPMAVSNCDNSISIYPTYTDGKVIVRTNIEQPESVIQITDALGKSVITENLPENWAEKTVDLSKYENGLYFINISSQRSNFFRKVMLSR